MQIDKFLLSLLIPIIGFFFECYPRLLNRNVGVDIWTHLLYLKEYHKQKGIPKEITEGFLVQGRYDYPPMFILILSKFSIDSVRKYEFLFSPFFDAIHLLIIFHLAFYLSDSVAIALLTQTLYVLTPIVVLENSSATPRSLGYTLFSLLFMCLFVFTQTGDMLYVTFAVLLGSIIFLSHRFTTQGFLFFSILFSVVFRDLIYIFVFLCSFIGALIISKGFYLTVLSGHLGNLKFWYNNIKYRFYHQIKGEFTNKASEDFVFKVYNQFISIPPIVLAVTNPWILFALLSLFFKIPSFPFQQQFYLWIGISYFLALVTIWVTKLRFLGEGQRYLELSAFPAAFIAAYTLMKVSSDLVQTIGIFAYILTATAALVTIIVIQRKAIIKDSLRTLTPDLEKMFHYLKTLKKKPRLLCIPHQITTNTIYHTDCPVFVNADYTNIEKISDVYPFLKKPLATILKKHNLDGVLLNEKYATYQDLKVTKYKEVKRVGNYVYFTLS